MSTIATLEADVLAVIEQRGAATAGSISRELGRNASNVIAELVADGRLASRPTSGGRHDAEYFVASGENDEAWRAAEREHERRAAREALPARPAGSHGRPLAAPAPPAACTCPRPFGDGETCALCGRAVVGGGHDGAMIDEETTEQNGHEPEHDLEVAAAVDAPEPVRRVSRATVAELCETLETFSRGQLGAELGLGAEAIRQHVHRLVADGLIRQLGGSGSDARYAWGEAPEPGPAAVVTAGRNNAPEEPAELAADGDPIRLAIVHLEAQRDRIGHALDALEALA